MRARKSAALLVALTLGLSALASAPASADSPPISLPSSPKGLTAPVTLPSGIDPASPYLPQAMCYPADLPGVVKLRDRVLATYGQGGRGNISRGCTEGVSEHSEGRAWDWMIDPGSSKQKAAAADFLSWVTRNNGQNARRLGIMYVIYDEKIWAVYRAGDGWRPSSGHKDHVHVSFSWNGARGNTSFWTGKVGVIDYGPCVRFSGTPGVLTSAPRPGACPGNSTGLVKKTSRPDRLYGSTGTNVKQAQKMLGVAQSGTFDRTTWVAVRRFQQANELPYTGALDQPTWATLSPADVTSRTTWGYTRDKAIDYGLARGSSVLKYPMVGTSVAITQVALNMKLGLRNGYYGPLTLAAVKSFQKSHGLSQTGQMGPKEWKALDALR